MAEYTLGPGELIDYREGFQIGDKGVHVAVRLSPHKDVVEMWAKSQN